MRIVIIGGSGMIGSAVSKLAVERGHQVVILTRQTPPAIKNTQNPQYQHWDGKHAESLDELIDGCHVVINLAGQNIGDKRWTERRKQELLQSRLEPSTAIVAAIKKCNKRPAALMQASAVGIYGTGDEVKTESSSPGTDYLSKLAIQWEEATREVEGLGVRRVVIRSGVVLQKRRGVLARLELPFKLFIGGPIGSGRQVYSWIHINDEAAAILFLVEKSTCRGVYNLTAPNPETNSQFGRILGKVMQKPFWLPVPGFALRMVLGEMSTLVLDGQRVLPKRLLEEGYVFEYSGLQSALVDLLKAR